MSKKRTPKIEVEKGSDGQWYWHLRGGNGRVMCSGEGHPSAANARRAADGVMRAMRHPALRVVTVV